MKKIILSVAAVVVLSVVSYFAMTLRQGGEAIPDDDLSLNSQLDDADKQKVFLYFTARDGLHLSVTTADISASAGRQQQVRQVFELLCVGPVDDGSMFPVLPPGASLTNVFLAEDGRLYLNLSLEMGAAHPGGTTGELLSVYAIVNSLSESFDWVKGVTFLQGGKPLETLAGHLNLSGKLVYNDDIIALIDDSEEMQEVDKELNKDVIR
jgi:hypothetical protein